MNPMICHGHTCMPQTGQDQRLHSHTACLDVQDQREEGLKGFRDGTFPVLVATDVAGRGIDVPDVRHPLSSAMPIFWASLRRTIVFGSLCSVSSSVNTP